MHAYLLDPVDLAISKITYLGNWRDIAALISWDDHDVRVFITVQINEAGDTLYLDDEGLFGDPRYWLLHRCTGNWFAGKGLVLGCDEHGNATSPTCTLPWLRREFALARATERKAS